MDRQHVPRFQQLDGAKGVVWAHRVVVADWQYRQVEPFFADERHITEKARVGRIINPGSVGERHNEAARVAAVGPIRKRRAVECQGQLDADAAAECEAAPMLKAVNLLQPARVLLKPRADLEVGKDRRAGALGDRNRIANVVTMTVRDQDQVGLNLIGGLRRLGIPRQKRVDQYLLAAAFQQEAGMTEPVERVLT